MTTVFFSERISKVPVKAQQLFPILQFNFALESRVTSYIKVANLLGYSDARLMGRILGYILFYCIKYNLPPLTRIVFNKSTSKPGMPIVEAMKLFDVFGYDDWRDIIPPTAKKLKQAYEEINERVEKIAEKEEINYENALFKVMREYDYEYMPEDFQDEE